jgi:hypothetical protein
MVHAGVAQGFLILPGISHQQHVAKIPRYQGEKGAILQRLNFQSRQQQLMPAELNQVALNYWLQWQPAHRNWRCMRQG